MAQTELTVSTRKMTGKGGSRALRRQGLVPATVYGKGLEPCSITVDPKELEAAIATETGWNTLLTLKGEGPFSGQVVILKETQVDAIRREITHADFQTVDLQKKVQVMVPVHPVGKAEGEKAGGSLQLIRHEVEVSCLPAAIPAAIEVDVTAMAIGDVLHVKDLVLPAGVALAQDGNYTVITVTGRKAEEEAVTVEAEEETEV